MEEIRICAFFDVLGTREIMMGEDEGRRHELIKLVQKLSANSSSYSPNVQNLGLGVVMSPSAQSTSFSDNVAVSFPIKRLNIPGKIGNEDHTFFVEASSFFDHLLAQIVIAVWDGLKMGLLFRGGISMGRLVHNDQIIAGEALVKAVELEKETKFPRVEIEEEIINLKDDNGNFVIKDYVRDECLEKIDDRWFVKSLIFHNGYWRDHNWYRQQEGKGPEEIPVVLKRIKERLDQEKVKIDQSSVAPVKEKWDWFMDKFKRTILDENWNLIKGAKEIMND
ncbi:MAG: hypothetical protein COW00_02890 [Bdellovibrio sp. CG12_big_fil_rev_8_21_14_0_65_39_13]|nr:MAG: hypothetical protein COW78_00795 [Bdellovibrio sp. CG22_combo_CG10-13_8_21_14_all_39_27]PIQ61792.1 MAG: hypothetical protein COW00_02890 [Bdellovibrio sp. CG12_big_fil_rev_8_21_14_0_65_39_13]PIR33655.1 MAG: hypothetical protein COV37_15555 [Bdellovibrio sp. CG11_big_fil_rev_8_21_14_0_20_39_38]